MTFLSWPLTSTISLSSSMLSLRRPRLVVDLDFIEHNGGLLWSSSNASSVDKINAESIFSKPLKLFSCYVSTMHRGASSRQRDEQYHFFVVAYLFFSLGGAAKKDPTEIYSIILFFHLIL